MHLPEKRRPIATTSIVSAVLRGIGLGIVLSLAAGCTEPAAAPEATDAPATTTNAPQTAATVAMAERLASLDRTLNPLKNHYRADRLAAFFEHVEPPPDLRSAIQQRARYASALLHDGQNEAAIRALEGVLDDGEANEDLFKPAFFHALRDLLALAYLRLGEQRNCLERHAPNACLLPLRGGGVHHDGDPAREAASRYRALLASKPDDLTTRWLLNLATMASEGSVATVPAAWRLPSDAFPEDPHVAPWPDVASTTGLDVPHLSGGTVVDDLDGDGLLDVMASSWRLDHPILLFRNRGDGGFDDVTPTSGLTGITGGLNLVHADYDNDGDVDVFVLRGAWLAEEGQHPNSLLRNNGIDREGHLRFEDVTEAAGVLDAFPTQTAAWADYDGDGWLDLFVGAETAGGRQHPCRLYRNRGDGTFENVARDAGVATIGFVKAAVWGDVDNDGRPDLYLSRLGQPNMLFRNEGADDAGQWRFTNIAAAAGVTEPRHSFPTWFWDVDNDGWLDLFVSGYPAEVLVGDFDGVAANFFGVDTNATTPRLYRNRGIVDGKVQFDDVTVAWGLDKVLYTMGSNVGDVDNDGWPDAYLGTGAPDYRALMPNRLLRNRAGTGFDDRTWSTRTGHLQKGHAVAFADLDNDGDQDLYMVLGGAFSGDTYPNALFENPGTPHHWLTLRLEGVQANRSAIGARLALTLTADDGRARSVHALVGTGGSFGSASLQQELGLGTASKVDRLTITWPGSGTVQTFDNVAADRIYAVREGESMLRPVSLPTFRLGTGSPAHAEGGHHAGGHGG